MTGGIVVVAGIVIAVFMFGAIIGLIILVAAAVNREDQVTMRRPDRSLALRGEAPGLIARGVRRVSGVGVWNGPARR